MNLWHSFGSYWWHGEKYNHSMNFRYFGVDMALYDQMGLGLCIEHKGFGFDFLHLHVYVGW